MGIGYDTRKYEVPLNETLPCTSAWWVEFYKSSHWPIPDKPERLHDDAELKAIAKRWRQQLTRIQTGKKSRFDNLPADETELRELVSKLFTAGDAPLFLDLLLGKNKGGFFEF